MNPLKTTAPTDCPDCLRIGDERDALARQLIGARAEIEKYRLREWACYKELGYDQPTNDALPHLIECMMALKVTLQENLERCAKAAGWNAEMTIPVWDHITQMRKKLTGLEGELEEKASACAEMRHALQWLHDLQNGPPLLKWEAQWNAAMKAARKALSSDCGKDFISRERVRPLVQACSRLVHALDWDYYPPGLVMRFKHALAHAKELGI